MCHKYHTLIRGYHSLECDKVVEKTTARTSASDETTSNDQTKSQEDLPTPSGMFYTCVGNYH